MSANGATRMRVVVTESGGFEIRGGKAHRPRGDGLREPPHAQRARECQPTAVSEVLWDPRQEGSLPLRGLIYRSERFGLAAAGISACHRDLVIAARLDA